MGKTHAVVNFTQNTIRYIFDEMLLFARVLAAPVFDHSELYALYPEHPTSTDRGELVDQSVHTHKGLAAHVHPVC